MNSLVDILILSNGPGEVTTWLRPVVKALRKKLSCDRARISVILSPCPHATGKEAAIAQSYLEVDRVLAPEYFWFFLLWGKTQENWDWSDRGVVVFLGGDQAFSIIIGKRLGYRTVIYAEWEARWYRWGDRFCARQSSLLDRIRAKYRQKFTVVGDLMADVTTTPAHPSSSVQIALLPGSKAAKLTQGVPLCLAIAQSIAAQRPQTRFLLPVAPTLDLETLASYADRDRNPIMAKFGSVGARLILPSNDKSDRPLLKTDRGIEIELILQFPAHEFLSQCHLALTTIGANTAELGALAIPAIVLLPTQQLDAMRSWDGIPGILANLPFLGSAFAKIINWVVSKQNRLFAWPNIWAGEEIMPELMGELQPETVANLVLDYLDSPEKLDQMRDRLLAVRGKSGASERIAAIVEEQLKSSTSVSKTISTTTTPDRS